MRAFRDFEDTAYPFFESDTPVPRMFACVVFSCLAILRLEGCLNSTLQQYYWNPLRLAESGRREQIPRETHIAYPG